MKRVFALTFMLVMLVVSFCWAKETTEQEIEAKTKPVVQRFFDALAAKDYEGMCRDFTDKMIKAVPAKKLEKEDKKDISTYGEIVSWEYSGWMRDEGYDIVLTEVKYAEGTKFQYKFVFKTGPNGKKIGGLWKKPLPKGLSKVLTDSYLDMFGSVAESHLTAMKNKDYEQATKNFSAKMLEVLGPEKLKNSVVDGESGKIGDVVSWKFDFAAQKGEFILLYYQAKYSKGETMSYQIVFLQDGKDKKIQGLWLKPLDTE